MQKASAKAMHLLLGTVLLLLAFLSAACVARAAGLGLISRSRDSRPAPVNPMSSGTTAGPTLVLPPQGLYESCMPSEPDCLARLDAMAAKGFRIVLNDGLRYAYSAKDLRAYADHAADLGMEFILPVKYFPEWDGDDKLLVKTFPDLAAEGRCTDNPSFLAYYIGILRDHPALWGYYMADEVHSEHYDGLKVYSDIVKDLDPDHPRLIVEEGTNDPMEIFFTFHSYMRDTTDVVGSVNFPYGYIDSYHNVSRYTAASARMLQYWSGKLGLKSAIVLQAFAWPQDKDVAPLCSPWPACAPFPSYEQIKALRDQAILNSRPEVILWFYYPWVLSSDNPSGHWSDLAAAAFAPLPGSVPPPTTRPQSCPPSWTCEDIGNPELEGTQAVSGSAWTVEGSGWDIWSHRWVDADQFRYVWQGLAADGEIVARVLGQRDTNADAKAGVMLRKTFDPVSPYYAVFVTPGRGIRVQYRSGYNDDPIDLASWPEALPVHLKITRSGTNYSAAVSGDGAGWTLIPGSTVELSGLNGSVMAGVAVTSHDTSVLGEARFDDVVIVRGPRVWLPTMVHRSSPLGS